MSGTITINKPTAPDVITEKLGGCTSPRAVLERSADPDPWDGPQSNAAPASIDSWMDVWRLLGILLEHDADLNVRDGAPTRPTPYYKRAFGIARNVWGARSAPFSGHGVCANPRDKRRKRDETALDGAAAGNGRPYGTRARDSRRERARTRRARRAGGTFSPGFVAFSTRENRHPWGLLPSPPSPSTVRTWMPEPAPNLAPLLRVPLDPGFSDVVQVLSSRTVWRMLMHQDYRCLPPLHRASESRCQWMQIAGNDNNWTQLHLYGGERGDSKLVQLLLLRGTAAGRLQEALPRGHRSVLRLSSEHGRIVNAAVQADDQQQV